MCESVFFERKKTYRKGLSNGNFWTKRRANDCKKAEICTKYNYFLHVMKYSLHLKIGLIITWEPLHDYIFKDPCKNMHTGQKEHHIWVMKWSRPRLPQEEQLRNRAIDIRKTKWLYNFYMQCSRTLFGSSKIQQKRIWKKNFTDYCTIIAS